VSNRDNDLALLRACIAEWYSKRDAAEDDGVEEPNWYEPFRGMLAGLTSGAWDALTEKQRRWVKGVHERLFDEPQYENLFSSGKVALGGYGKTPTPEVLKKPLPMKPPRRAP
jgi:hypothetical protein